jgi:hypothetical protein
MRGSNVHMTFTVHLFFFRRSSFHLYAYDNCRVNVEQVRADTSATFALEASGQGGWVALGFPKAPGAMVDSTAVIATTSAANGQIGVFSLNGQSVAEVVEIPGAILQAPGGNELSNTDQGFSVFSVRHLSSQTFNSTF